MSKVTVNSPISEQIDELRRLGNKMVKEAINLNAKSILADRKAADFFARAYELEHEGT